MLKFLKNSNGKVVESVIFFKSHIHLGKFDIIHTTCRHENSQKKLCKIKSENEWMN